MKKHAACRARIGADTSSRASTESGGEDKQGEEEEEDEEQDGKEGEMADEQTSNRPGDAPNADQTCSKRRFGSWSALAKQVCPQASAGKVSQLTGGLPNLCHPHGALVTWGWPWPRRSPDRPNGPKSGGGANRGRPGGIKRFAFGGGGRTQRTSRVTTDFPGGS